MKATHIRCAGPKPDYSAAPRRTGTPPVWQVFAADNYGMAVSQSYTFRLFGLALLLMRRMARERRMRFAVFHPDCPGPEKGNCSTCKTEPYSRQCLALKPRGQ